MRLLVAGAAFVLGSTAAAQTTTPLPPDPARDSAVSQALASVGEGRPIRVALMRSSWGGTHLGVRGDTLFLGAVGETHPMGLRFNAIDSVWTRGRHTSRGVIIGALAGAAVGAASVVGSLDDRTDSGGAALAGAGLGAVGGALTGALIGRGFRHWRRVFP